MQVRMADLPVPSIAQRVGCDRLQLLHRACVTHIALLLEAVAHLLRAATHLTAVKAVLGLHECRSELSEVFELYVPHHTQRANAILSVENRQAPASTIQQICSHLCAYQ